MTPAPDPRDRLSRFVQVFDDALPAAVCAQLVHGFEALRDRQVPNGRDRREWLAGSAWTELDIGPMCDDAFRQSLMGGAHHFLGRYNEALGLTLPVPATTKTSEWILKRYRSGGDERFQPHFDSIGTVANRYLVFLWYLNDVAEGGETAFVDVDVAVRPRTGRLLVFPPYWMFQHEGRPPISGDKYILSTYLLFLSAAMSTPTLAALARAVYELSSDLRAFGPEAERVLAEGGGTEAQALALLGHVHGLRQSLAAARPAWLAAQRERLGLTADARNVKLHLGCGAHALPGWVNLDVHPAPLCWNVQWGLPFVDGAATHVFVSHLFEHLFFPHDAMGFLLELKRVLAPGGRVRIVVPDVAQLIDAYQRGDRDFFARRAAHWAGARGDGPLLAQFLNYAGAGPDPGFLFEAHKFGYDFDTLAHLLREAGFEGVVRSDYMASEDATLRVDDQSAVAGAEHGGGHYSLFVEAVAPGAPMPAMPSPAHEARRRGVVLMAERRLEDAEAAFREAIRLDGRMPAAHLQLGRLLESTGRAREAVAAYFRALTIAQSREQWLDEASTPPGLRADVLHAMQVVREQRVPVLMGLIEPLEARFGREAMARVRAGLAHWLGVEAHPPADARQAPRFLHVPGLPATPWFDTSLFPWLPQLESAFPAMRDEALAVLAAREGVRPFLAGNDGASLDPYLGGGATARWDAFFFYRDGEHHADAARHAPRTAAMLESLPLVRIREHAPEICFSILAPGTHIKPHHGVTNARVVVHLPLIVPRGCTLTVGGDEREWQAGRAWSFDDTFLHEARNTSAETRVILLMDAWNPHLTDVERVAVTEIVEGIGEFNRG